MLARAESTFGTDEHRPHARSRTSQLPSRSAVAVGHDEIGGSGDGVEIGKLLDRGNVDPTRLHRRFPRRRSGPLENVLSSGGIPSHDRALGPDRCDPCHTDFGETGNDRVETGLGQRDREIDAHRRFRNALGIATRIEFEAARSDGRDLVRAPRARTIGRSDAFAGGKTTHALQMMPVVTRNRYVRGERVDEYVRDGIGVGGRKRHAR